MPRQIPAAPPPGGDANRLDQRFGQVYDELRAMAQQRLQRHRPGQTLDTTALVHEAYLRLVDRAAVRLQDRNHFLALASRAMRFLVVDDARTQTRRKRGGAPPPTPPDALRVAAEDTWLHRCMHPAAA